MNKRQWIGYILLIAGFFGIRNPDYPAYSEYWIAGWSMMIIGFFMSVLPPNFIEKSKNILKKLKKK